MKNWIKLSDSYLHLSPLVRVVASAEFIKTGGIRTLADVTTVNGQTFTLHGYDAEVLLKALASECAE